MAKDGLATDLILLQRQALGDVVVMTALVRDLHLLYPGQFRTMPSTSFSNAVWAYNPYISRVPRPPGSQAVTMHYGEQFKAAKSRRMHFMEGYIEYFNAVVGARHDVKVRLTKPKPDLYLSRAEAAAPPRGLKRPYWVMMAGGKADMPTKWWDRLSYQAVVDGLQGRVNFVQCGGRSDYHANLSGTVNLVGKTTAREFIQVIAHADGVVCPITAAMHIAAAFDKPSVVIAGGREMWWWEHYPLSTYLHTIGDYDCCRTTGCYRATTTQRGKSPCLQPLRAGAEGNVISVARCMHEIPSEAVIAAVEEYLSPSPPRPHSWPILSCPSVFGTPSAAAPTITKPPLRSRGSLTICAALYGGGPGNETYRDGAGELARFEDLHTRFLDGLLRSVPASAASLRVATNDVSPATLHLLQAISSRYDLTVYGPNENRLKYPRMREMFYDPRKPLDSDWVLWLDDDVLLTREDWLERVWDVIEKNPQARCFGRLYRINVTEPQLRWMKSRPWWRGVPLSIAKGAFAGQARFITGGAWAARVADLKELDWPDEGIKHNGGDVALGVAMLQRRWELCDFGPLLDQHNTPRRGVSMPPPALKRYGTMKSRGKLRAKYSDRKQRLR